MIKKIINTITAVVFILITTSTAFAVQLLEPVITSDEVVAVRKSIILDASQSFLPDPDEKYEYEWDFGDGNKNEGVDVLHVYKDPGKYTITLTIKDKYNEATVKKEIFAYKKLILLLTDSTENESLINTIKGYAEKEGVFIKIIDSFGSTSEFISEEILSKKLMEALEYLKKSTQIAVWTKENAGLNALSRLPRENIESASINFSQKSITVVTDNIEGYSNRIKRQFESIKPKNIILIREAGIYPLIDNFTSTEFVQALKEKGYEHSIITEGSYSLRPWNFMSYFLSSLINKGIPDNTIALLLLIPVIATVVVVMKQIVGLTTMGIYTPIIITLSFLIIGLYFGLFTLITILIVGGLARHLMRKARLLFLPKMAIVLTLVAITLFLILILGAYTDMFNAKFFSLAIFPMVILSTLVEKFVSIKTEKGLPTAVILMLETIIVSILAYFVAGGEINLGFTTIQLETVRNLILNYPESILLLLIINFLLGKWSGLRLLEYIRFREVIRHLEEE